MIKHKIKNFILDFFDIRSNRILKKILKKYPHRKYHPKNGIKYLYEINFDIERQFDTKDGKLLDRNVKIKIGRSTYIFRGAIFFVQNIFCKKEFNNMS